MLDFFASKTVRRQAAEEARYAIGKYGQEAEARLRLKMAQTENPVRRKAYQLALKSLSGME